MRHPPKSGKSRVETCLVQLRRDLDECVRCVFLWYIVEENCCTFFEVISYGMLSARCCCSRPCFFLNVVCAWTKHACSRFLHATLRVTSFHVVLKASVIDVYERRCFQHRNIVTPAGLRKVCDYSCQNFCRLSVYSTVRACPRCVHRNADQAAQILSGDGLLSQQVGLQASRQALTVMEG